jgi:hypothetical protein
MRYSRQYINKEILHTEIITGPDVVREKKTHVGEFVVFILRFDKEQVKELPRDGVRSRN